MPPAKNAVPVTFDGHSYVLPKLLELLVLAFELLDMNKSWPPPNTGPFELLQQIPFWFEEPFNFIFVGATPDVLTKLNKKDPWQCLYPVEPERKKEKERKKNEREKDMKM